HVPCDVVTMVCAWGPDDPRTTAEIERLMDHWYERSVAAEPPTAPAHAVPAKRVGSEGAKASTAASRPTLAMSSRELAALLALTPEQQAVVSTLVRQADLVVTADAPA